MTPRNFATFRAVKEKRNDECSRLVSVSAVRTSVGWRMVLLYPYVGFCVACLDSVGNAKAS
ncbi:MAG: hypothetical protein LIP09_07545 [Bacteroidales bacterium]|nr:hypothetical protein [Bacteroidales bacterium]